MRNYEKRFEKTSFKLRRKIEGNFGIIILKKLKKCWTILGNILRYFTKIVSTLLEICEISGYFEKTWKILPEIS